MDQKQITMRADGRTNTGTSNKDKFNTPNLEDTNLVSNVHSFAVVGKTNESLLEAKRSNDSVNLSTLYIIEFANSMADLSLVSTEINEERKNTFRLQVN